VGITVQVSVVVVVVVDEELEAASFLQEFIAGITMPMPNAASPLRKNVFLSIGLMFLVISISLPNKQQVYNNIIFYR
jgi:hypothetical protein